MRPLTISEMKEIGATGVNYEGCTSDGNVVLRLKYHPKIQSQPVVPTNGTLIFRYRVEETIHLLFLFLHGRFIKRNKLSIVRQKETGKWPFSQAPKSIVDFGAWRS